MKMFLKFLIAFAILSLVACGGGGDSSPPPAPPVNTYIISGTTTPGATLTLSGQASASTTADAVGVFSFASIANGSYTVTPSLTGYSFTPASLAVTVSGSNVLGVTFTGTLNTTPTYSISGVVTGLGAGVTISISPGGASTTTNASGAYSFTGLANGNYTVVPSYTGYSFAPASTTVTISNANPPSANFVATAIVVPTYSVSGTVSGLVAGGVTITVTPGGITAVTDTNGYYTVSGLVANTVYTITPSLPGHTFSPSSLSGYRTPVSDVVGADFFEPVPVLASGVILFPGFSASTKLSQGGFDGSIYNQNLWPASETRMFGGWGYPITNTPAYTVFPDSVIQARAKPTEYVISAWNLPCLYGMHYLKFHYGSDTFMYTDSSVTCITPTGVLPTGSFDVMQNADAVVIAQVFPGSPSQQNIMLYKANGSGSLRVTNGVDVDSSPVFANASAANSASVIILFNRNGSTIMKQEVNGATGTLVGTATVFVSNVVERVANDLSVNGGYASCVGGQPCGIVTRDMSVNGDYTQLAFMRNVGGITHIFVKPLAGGAEVDVVAGTDPFWATTSTSQIMYTANGKRYAINADGSGKDEVPTPSNIAINGVEGAACGDACLSSIVPAYDILVEQR